MEINIIAIKAIKKLYKNAISKIKIGKFVSEEIKVEKGLRQGLAYRLHYSKYLYIQHC
jgi:hypothetical protein